MRQVVSNQGLFCYKGIVNPNFDNLGKHDYVVLIPINTVESTREGSMCINMPRPMFLVNQLTFF